MLKEVVLAFLLVAITYLLYRLARIIRFIYFYQIPLIKDLPGPECLPIIGCIHKMPKKLKDVPVLMFKWSKEALERGQNMLKFLVGPFVIVMPINHESVAGIINSNEFHKGRDYAYFEKWLGPGLLLGAGERWHKTRRIATPAFHFSKLEEYAQTIDYHCRTLIGILSKKEDNKQIDMYHYIKLCALDTIADTTMGVQLNAQQNSEQPYVKAVEDFNRLACTRSLHIYLKPRFMWRLFGYEKKEDEIVDVLHSFTKKVIKERMEIYREDKEGIDTSSNTKLNFLDLMLQLNEDEKLSEQHLREEVDTIMFAGHDTTAHAVSWAIWCFAHHPEVQQRVFEELCEHFGNSDSEFCTKKLRDLKYFDQCFKEVLRLLPPVPAVLRFTHNEIEMSGHTIPKYTSITIPIILIHRNPNIFENPEKFDPDRFAEGKEYPPLSYIPFSAGARNCIGQRFAKMEVKIMLAHILFNFKIESDHRFEDNELSFEAVLRPSLGIPVRLIKRQH